jgi:hypothetical protein
MNAATARATRVIPSGGAKRRSRGISVSFRAERARSARAVEESLILAVETLLYRDDSRFLDSAPSALRSE